jgi:hypothetical protein
MEKTFTLLDLQNYLLEISFLEQRASEKIQITDGPRKLTIQNLLRYSSALNIMKTQSAGTVYQLAN